MNSLWKIPCITVCVAVLCLLAACERKAEAPAPRPPEVIVSHPVEKEVTDYLEFTGQTDALEFVQIKARVEGWLESINFTPGAMVKKDQVLFIIDPKPYKAQVDQNQALVMGKKADLNLAQTNLKRAQQLLQTASISQLQYDENKAKELVAQAQVGVADADLEKAQLNLSYTTVTSPINGRVSRNMVDLGNLVGATEKTLLTEIVNDSQVYVYFDASERDFLKLRRLYPAKVEERDTREEEVPVFMQLADETGYPHKGKLDFMEPRIDPSTGTLQARAIFPNEDRLLVSGLFARIRVPYRRDKALLAPESAVGITQGGRYVLIVNKDNVVEQRMVETGQLDNEMRVILKGISKDDRVVVNGIQRARPGRKVQPKESTDAEKVSGEKSKKASGNEAAATKESSGAKPKDGKTKPDASRK